MIGGRDSVLPALLLPAAVGDGPGRGQLHLRDIRICLDLWRARRRHVSGKILNFALNLMNFALK